MKLSTKTVSAILERWMNEGIITDHCAEYGEPGYLVTSDTGCVVLGNYWCECGKDIHREGHRLEGRRPLHAEEDHHPLLWAQLEAQGVNFEWHDEWAIDYENGKAYRTKPDSYAWMQAFVWTDDGEGMLTSDDDIDAWIEWATASNEPRCLPGNIWSKTAIIDAGFTKHDGEFQAGFHSGQTDTAESATEAVRREHGFDVTVVFRVDGVGQFDSTYSAYWRAGESEPAEDAWDGHIDVCPSCGGQLDDGVHVSEFSACLSNPKWTDDKEVDA